MTEEIKRIIEELKDNIPIEECRSEGTSDGLTHYEEDKDSWQYKLFDYITNLQQKDFESQKEITKLKDKLEQQRIEYQDTYKDVRIEIKEKNERIANLQQENEKLKYNARGQVNDYFKDKYADEVLKKTNLIKDFELTSYKNYELKQENEKLKNFIANLISELNHFELNGTKKLDIVSDYIKQEYEKALNGSDENE